MVDLSYIARLVEEYYRRYLRRPIEYLYRVRSRKKRELVSYLFRIAGRLDELVYRDFIRYSQLSLVLVGGLLVLGILGYTTLRYYSEDLAYIVFAASFIFSSYIMVVLILSTFNRFLSYAIVYSGMHK